MESAGWWRKFPAVRCVRFFCWTRIGTAKLSAFQPATLHAFCRSDRTIGGSIRPGPRCLNWPNHRSSWKHRSAIGIHQDERQEIAMPSRILFGLRLLEGLENAVPNRDSVSQRLHAGKYSPAALLHLRSAKPGWAFFSRLSRNGIRAPSPTTGDGR